MTPDDYIEAMAEHGLREPDRRLDRGVVQWVSGEVVVTMRVGTTGRAEWDARWPDPSLEQGWNGNWAPYCIEFIPDAARDISRVLEDRRAIYCVGRDYQNEEQAQQMIQAHLDRQAETTALLKRLERRR